jgi:hypothetical protein
MYPSYAYSPNSSARSTARNRSIRNAGASHADDGRLQQRYDYRLRNLVQRTGDMTLATDLRVLARRPVGGSARAPEVVVSLDVTDLRASELQQEVLELRRRVKKLTPLLRLALAMVPVSLFRSGRSSKPVGGRRPQTLPRLCWRMRASRT